VHGRLTPKQLRQELERRGILVIDISKTQVRMLTHLDITEKMVEQTVAAINEI
jgi:threonine aldolase